MCFRTSRKSLSLLSLVVVTLMASATPARAQDDFIPHWNGWGDLQISTNGVVTAGAAAGGWIETIWAPHEENISFGCILSVDGQVVNSVYIFEGLGGIGETLSRDPNNPDDVPISWQYQLGPGTHTVTFMGYLWCDSQVYGSGEVVQFFDITRVVTIP